MCFNAMASNGMLPEESNWLALSNDYNRIANEAEQRVEPNPIDYPEKSLAREYSAIEKED